jgi:hypothetical protein
MSCMNEIQSSICRVYLFYLTYVTSHLMYFRFYVISTFLHELIQLVSVGT